MRTLSLLFLLATALPSQAAFKLLGGMGGNAVIQQGVPVPLWGLDTSTPPNGNMISVTFRTSTASCVTDAVGNWRIDLPAQAVTTAKDGAGNFIGDNLVFKRNGAVALTAGNTLVGDVWFGSGQSNMSLHGDDPLWSADAPTQAYLNAAVNNNVRFQTGGWGVATGAKRRSISCLGGIFAERLQFALDIPIGLIVGAASGRPTCEFIEASDYAATGFPPPSTGNVTGKQWTAVITPFLPCAVRGILWDQGEAGSGTTGVAWNTMMVALIGSWRTRFNAPALQFFYFQKPSGAPPDAEFVSLATDTTGAFAIPVSDLCAALHPACKVDYAERAVSVVTGAPLPPPPPPPACTCPN